MQTIKYLLAKTRVNVNAQNVNGLTALDILVQSRRTMKDMYIALVVREAGGLEQVSTIRVSIDPKGLRLFPLPQMIKFHNHQLNVVHYERIRKW